MANLGLKERYDFQQWIIKDLKEKNAYIQRAATCYDPRLAMDVELLWDFLMETQEETMEYLLKKLSKETIINLINTEIVKGGFLFALKEGVFIENKQLRLLYRKPATSFNEKSLQQYQANRLSVIEEVQSTATHIILTKYKDHGTMFVKDDKHKRMVVTP